jgi:hypothetical protein
VIVGAHREALGPLTDLEIAAISTEAARSPEFNEGMAAAAADFNATATDPAVGAFGLVSWIARILTQTAPQSPSPWHRHYRERRGYQGPAVAHARPRKSLASPLAQSQSSMR